MVFEVTNVEEKKRYAMKVEPSELKRRDQLIKIEAFVLKKMQFSKYAPAYICYGNSVDDLHYSVPNRRFSESSALRVGLQALEAVTDLHRIGFVHRDIKPSNFAFGLGSKSNHLFIFDFGMARSIIDMKENNKLRKPRKKANFRGTTLFCSPNVHIKKEQGRHDDLWSLLYMCIYMIVGSLPWSKRGRGNAGMIKDARKKFATLLKYFRSLSYTDKPDYRSVKGVFEACMKTRGINMCDPYEWEADNMHIVKQFKKEKSIRSFTAIDGLNSSSRGSDTCEGFTSASAELDTLEVFTPPSRSIRTAIRS